MCKAYNRVDSLVAPCASLVLQTSDFLNVARLFYGVIGLSSCLLTNPNTPSL